MIKNIGSFKNQYSMISIGTHNKARVKHPNHKYYKYIFVDGDNSEDEESENSDSDEFEDDYYFKPRYFRHDKVSRRYKIFKQRLFVSYRKKGSNPFLFTYGLNKGHLDKLYSKK